MPTLPLGPDELLATTRAVRRGLDLERPVDLALVRECLELALQAPSGSNAQGWHFVVVSDAAKRRRIGELYQQAFAAYRSMPFSAHALAEQAQGDERPVMEGVMRSAEALAANLARVPVHLIPCVLGRTDQATGTMGLLAQASLFGSILPATWSFMLAARARGLGTAWTTLHLMFEQDAATLLGIPDTITQTALFPVAHIKGSEFKPAKRLPPEGRTHWNQWGKRR
jgi:nitroreductase